MRGRLHTVLILLLAFTTLSAQVPQKVLESYPCVRYERNELRFPDGHGNMDKAWEKLDSVLLFGKGGFNIWHVGGSHVQADFFSHRMRVNLGTFQYGVQGVRGVLFPHSLASTNYNKNYSFDCFGSWTCCSNMAPDGSMELGLSGRSCMTADSTAGLHLVLNRADDVRWQFSSIRIFGYGSSDDVYPYIKTEDGEICGVRDDAGYLIELQGKFDAAYINLHIPEGGSFTFTGLIPENGGKGIRYFSSGVNGASVPAWLRCSRLEQELSVIRPDLVFFAIGVNDAAVPYGSFREEMFKKGYRQLISMLRRINPECMFVFITNNDIYKYGSANLNTIAVQNDFYELAGECGGAVWDLFDIMGGYDSIPSWSAAGLASSDLIHFTKQGYELIGDMLFNALIKDYMATN